MSYHTTTMNANASIREAFHDIYLNLSNKHGTTRFAESGWGWKPSGGGDTFTLDQTQIVSAQWSRAARGYEVKVLSRNDGVIQLDGFKHEVFHIRIYVEGYMLIISRTLIEYRSVSSFGTVSPSTIGNMRCAGGTGERRSSARQSFHSTSRTDRLSKSLTPRSPTRTWLARTKSPSISRSPPMQLILVLMVLLEAHGRGARSRAAPSTSL